LFGFLHNFVSLSYHIHSIICDILSSADRFPPDVSDWFISDSLRELLNFEDASLASQGREESQPAFKRSLKEVYDQLQDGMLFDMATGMRLPHATVIAAHIYQHKWRNQLKRFTTLTNIDDVRNGLLLYKPVEWAFDRAKMCVEVKPPNEMTFLLLDEDLRNVELADKACELRRNSGRGDLRNIEEVELHTTFGDLDRQPLKFPHGVVMRPLKRLLGWHAVAARWTAQANSPHDIGDVACDTSGDETTERSIRNCLVLTWRDGIY
jgi:hypothetical protein